MKLIYRIDITSTTTFIIFTLAIERGVNKFVLFTPSNMAWFDVEQSHLLWLNQLAPQSTIREEEKLARKDYLSTIS